MKIFLTLLVCVHCAWTWTAYADAVNQQEIIRAYQTNIKNLLRKSKFRVKGIIVDENSHPVNDVILDIKSYKLDDLQGDSKNYEKKVMSNFDLEFYDCAMIRLSFQKDKYTSVMAHSSLYQYLSAQISTRANEIWDEVSPIDPVELITKAASEVQPCELQLEYVIVMLNQDKLPWKQEEMITLSYLPESAQYFNLDNFNVNSYISGSSEQASGIRVYPKEDTDNNIIIVVEPLGFSDGDGIILQNDVANFLQLNFAPDTGYQNTMIELRNKDWTSNMNQLPLPDGLFPAFYWRNKGVYGKFQITSYCSDGIGVTFWKNQEEEPEKRRNTLSKGNESTKPLSSTETYLSIGN